MIRYFKIYGERNVGSNYLHLLIRENFNLQYLGHHWDSIFGWKHDIVNINKLTDSDNEYIRERTLFLHIYKNPYSWAVSMYKKPHHMLEVVWPDLLKNSNTPAIKFIDFLNTTWPEEKLFKSSHEKRSTIKIDLRNYKNIFDLREKKLKSHLDVKNHVENYIAISYEELLKNPNKFLMKIAARFEIQQNTFQDISYRCDPVPRNDLPYKDIHEYYLNELWKKYYNDNEIKTVNSLVNWDLENTIGYKKIIINDKEN